MLPLFYDSSPGLVLVCAPCESESWCPCDPQREAIKVCFVVTNKFHVAERDLNACPGSISRLVVRSGEENCETLKVSQS